MDSIANACGTLQRQVVEKHVGNGFASPYRSSTESATSRTKIRTSQNQSLPYGTKNRCPLVCLRISLYIRRLTATQLKLFGIY